MQEVTTKGGNVIDMAGYRGDRGFRAMRQVEAYWDGLRRGRDVPTRSDIDPRGIENALEYAFILEKIAPGLARIRIAGMHLSEVMGMEVRGMPITSFVRPEGRNAFSETMENVTTRPAVARLQLSAETGIGKPALEARMLLLPLRSDFGDISRVLGCFESLGQTGRAPRRFDVLRTELIELSGASPTLSRTARQTPLRPARPAAEGFAEPSAPFARPSASGAARRKWPSYLKLVKSDGG